ncbi:MAG TPA: WYL domain-containing protein [Arachnia sp.]|nr:WYL domain-containing protein [Arachnia sp.]
MSARKSERLLNLLIALLSTRRYLTKRELRHMVEGYRGGTVGGFERQFERDKEELRGLGVPIETGSNNPDSDEESGYRIIRSEFELPPLTFTPEELASLGVAGQVWQDSVAAEHTAQAFETLQAGGAAPDPALIPTVAPRVAVRDPNFDEVYEAVLTRTEVGFGYGGAPRRLQPWKLIQRRGQWYVFGLDPDRQADRFFKLGRMTAPAGRTGKPGSFVVPDDVDERAARLEPAFEAAAVIALRDDAAHSWQVIEPVEWTVELPPGFSAHRIRLSSESTIVDEVAASGTDAIVLAPPELRAQIIERLRRMAS